MAAGHPRAAEYPLGYLWDEFNLLKERELSNMLTEAGLMRDIVAAVLGGKEGAENLQKSFARLNVEAIPRKMPPT